MLDGCLDELVVQHGGSGLEIEEIKKTTYKRTTQLPPAMTR